MIRVQNLKKSFGRITAVNGISFTVEKGEVLGFLGPNGAGKSTTMRMITGFIPPTRRQSDRRRIRHAGRSARGKTPHRLSAGKRAVLRRHDRAWLSEFCGGTARACAAMRRERAFERAVEMCFLEPVLHQSVETLSKGYRHRTCFAQVDHSRSGGPDSGRADGWPRSESEARNAHADPAHGRERKRSFSPRTFWRKWKRFVRGRSSSIAAGSWRTARPTELKHARKRGRGDAATARRRAAHELAQTCAASDASRKRWCFRKIAVRRSARMSKETAIARELARAISAFALARTLEHRGIAHRRRPAR